MSRAALHVANASVSFLVALAVLHAVPPPAVCREKGATDEMSTGRGRGQ